MSDECDEVVVVKKWGCCAVWLLWTTRQNQALTAKLLVGLAQKYASRVTLCRSRHLLAFFPIPCCTLVQDSIEVPPSLLQGL